MTLSLKNWPFDSTLLPPATYLVGGAVRDGLLGRVSDYLDLDFVLLEQAVKTAQNIANHYKAGFVLLDRDRQIARVVFANATVDFAQAEGDHLEADLHRRDFTINAIAYHPATDTLIDPHNGQLDLQQGIIRMISPQNLQDDPLRLLRGYRQAAQLQFTLEPQTQQTIQQLAASLKQVAVERVQTELGYLLQTEHGVHWLQQAWDVGLISSWFPSAHHHWAILTAMDQAVKDLKLLQTELFQPLRNTLKTSLFALAKLTCLLTPDPDIAKAELLALKYSKIEIQGAVTLIQSLNQFQHLDLLNLSLKQQYFLFRDLGNLFPAFALWKVASGTEMNTIYPLIQRYLNSDDPVAHPHPLISGKELMAALQLRPSPQVGQLLAQLQIAQVEGKITTVKDAIAWAKQFIEED